MFLTEQGLAARSIFAPVFGDAGRTDNNSLLTRWNFSKDLLRI